jgi:type I restriction enzyme M protein
VQTKRKLLEECDVWCIVSLPGGVFSSAGAGVKTNLMFFTKGRPTEKIWYFDLSDIKVGKKTPFGHVHFEGFFRLLPKRADSERSWTVPFAARLQQALEEARPHRERAAQLLAEAAQHEDALREKRKAKSTKPAELKRLEERWKGVLREGREALSKAEAIENAVFDLKAVNPNKTNDDDRRTPAELLAVIEEKGREAEAALSRLRKLIER